MHMVTSRRIIVENASDEPKVKSDMKSNVKLGAARSRCQRRHAKYVIVNVKLKHNHLQLWYYCC